MLSFWQIFGQTLKKRFSRKVATMIDSLSFDLSVFIPKLSDCRQVKLSDGILDYFANLKSFCRTCMVSAALYDFSLSSLKLCLKALTCYLRMSRSSPISIASFFFLTTFYATCQVLQ